MTKALMVEAREGDSFDFGGLSVRWKVDGNQTGGRFSVVHHSMRFESGLTFPVL